MEICSECLVRSVKINGGNFKSTQFYYSSPLKSPIQYQSDKVVHRFSHNSCIRPGRKEVEVFFFL